jgi:TPR repeat protein
MKVFKYIFYSLFISVTLFALGVGLEYALSLYKSNQLVNNEPVVKELILKAQKGNIDAEFLLASAYKNGKLGKINLDKSYYWYSRAAENGDKDAMLMLGWLYYKGSDTIPVNIVKAKYWFSLAAKNGVEEAVEMLEILQ